MKSTFVKNLPIILFVAATFIFSNVNAANTIDEPFATISINKGKSFRPIVQLNFSAATASNFLVTVKDATGYILYTETFTATNLVKKYKLDGETAEVIDGTTFEIFNLTTKEKQNFVVNNKETFSSKLEIAEVK